jgi:hypothetical protein
MVYLGELCGSAEKSVLHGGNNSLRSGVRSNCWHPASLSGENGGEAVAISTDGVGISYIPILRIPASPHRRRWERENPWSNGWRVAHVAAGYVDSSPKWLSCHSSETSQPCFRSDSSSRLRAMTCDAYALSFCSRRDSNAATFASKV